MLDVLDERTIRANVDEVLQALYQNLQEHQEIVAEAQKGYHEKIRDAFLKAQDTLTKRLDALEQGELPPVSNITFDLPPPADHSKEFKTVIKMLELHKNAWHPDGGTPTIDLKAADVQRFVLNDWSWMSKFLRTNAAYSTKSQALAKDRGV